MQPLQCDLRLSDAKHSTISPAAAAARNLDAAIRLRSADTELQSTEELRATATQIEAFCSSKTDARNHHASEPTFLRSRTSVFPNKNAMFRANPNIQIASMM